MPPPLPEVLPVTTVVGRDKLTPDVAALVEPAVPLPAGVQFFERQFTTGSAVVAVLWAIGFAVFGLLSVVVGVAWAIESSKHVTVYRGTDLSVIGFGLLCWLITWVMFGTARDRLRLANEQAAGRSTRAGLFLTPDTLVDADSSSWTIIPRPNVGDVAAGSIPYKAKDQTKQIRLPAAFVGVDRATVEQAVTAWRQASRRTADPFAKT